MSNFTGKLRRYLRKHWNRFYDIINLKKGEDVTDFEGTIETIRKGVSIKGGNIWILVCGAIIASIGLDTNSPAIIIGAMLISPLMTPILGIGLFIGIYDRKNLVRAWRDFLAAVIVSLLMSIIYFAISPLAAPNEEILARVKPTLLDVGVAFFGGVAGIVSFTRKEKTNAIPGVAIAIALMPPICTAGFGLVTGHWLYFLGASYLFLINAFFITLATVLVVRVLGFPYRERTDHSIRRLAVRGAFVAGLIVVLPSAWLLRNVIEEQRTTQNIEKFVQHEINTKEHEAIRWELKEKKKGMDELKIYMIGSLVPEDQVYDLNRILPDYKVEKTNLELVQQTLPEETEEKIASEVKKQVKEELKEDSIRQEKKTPPTRPRKPISKFQMIRRDTTQMAQFRNETMEYFPDLRKLEPIDKSSSKVNGTPGFIIEWRKGLFWGFKEEKQVENLEKYLQYRLKSDTVILIDQ